MESSSNCTKRSKMSFRSNRNDSFIARQNVHNLQLIRSFITIQSWNFETFEDFAERLLRVC